MSQVDKEKLKTVFLRKRKTLTEEEFERRNAQIFYHVSMLLEEHEPSLVHTFLPIEKQKEVDTWIILKYLKAMGKIVVLPKSAQDTNDMSHFVFQHKKQLKKNSWGIWEPAEGVEIKSEEIDLVFIPLVIFDKAGYRIGYGKGYYDKFLSQCREDCIKVGLSLLNPIDKIEYVEPHDLRMDYCVSPIGVHDFRK